MARNRIDTNQPTSHTMDGFGENLAKARSSFRNESGKKKNVSKRLNNAAEKNIGVWTPQNQIGNSRKPISVTNPTGESRTMKTLESPASQSPHTSEQHVRRVSKSRAHGKGNVEEKNQAKRWKSRAHKNSSVGVTLNPSSQALNGTNGNVQAEQLKSSSSQQDYCYYDSDSDGYYYQTKGTCGWKRRFPLAASDGYFATQKAFMDSCLNSKLQGARFPAPHAYPIQQPSSNYQAHFGQNHYYDAVTDGFYFEMPSADGWKKRQTNLAQRQQLMLLPSTCHPNRQNFIGVQTCASNTPFDTTGLNHISQSYARHNSLTNNSICSTANTNKGVPKSSSVSTFSSGDDASTPPLHNFNSVNNQVGSLFPNGGDSLDQLSAHYNALSLNDIEEDNNFCERNSHNDYAFATRKNYETEDLENKPPPPVFELNEGVDENCRSSSDDCKIADEKVKLGKLIEHDVLKNFDADRFIADFWETNQDAHVSRMWSTSLVQQPSSLNFDPNVPQTTRSFFDEIGSGEFVGLHAKDTKVSEPRAKSKLGFWQSASHLKAVPCNNN